MLGDFTVGAEGTEAGDGSTGAGDATVDGTANGGDAAASPDANGDDGTVNADGTTNADGAGGGMRRRHVRWQGRVTSVGAQHAVQG